MPFCHLTLKAAKPKSPESPNELNTLGDHIRKRRLALGLYQRQVADRIAVTESTIFNWESNATTPSVRYLPAIIRFLGYNPLPEGKSVRERLVRARKLLGLSQELLAKRLGIDETTIWYFEKGGRRPSVKLKQAVESFLTTSCEDLS